MQNIHIGSPVALEWELCPDCRGWVSSLVALGCAAAGGRELGSCHYWWFWAFLSPWMREGNTGRVSWDPILFFLRFHSLIGKTNMKECRVIFPLLYVTSSEVLLSTCRREEDVWMEQKCPYFWRKQPTLNAWVTDIIIKLCLKLL